MTMMIEEGKGIRLLGLSWFRISPRVYRLSPGPTADWINLSRGARYLGCDWAEEKAGEGVSCIGYDSLLEAYMSVC